MKNIFNSNREGHLFAAFSAGIGVAISSVILGTPWEFYITAVTIPLWELYGTCDNDIDTRSPCRGPWYRKLWVKWWKNYALRTAHRSRLSHSILPGTFLRLGVGLWPVCWVVVIAEVIWDIPYLIPATIAVVSGCVIADCVHMAKDGYWPTEWLFGR